MSNEQYDAGDAFRRLKESLGSLMFCWCRFEDAVKECFRSPAIDETQNVGDTLAQQLSALKARLLAEAHADDGRAREICELFDRIGNVRRRRNLIVHGLAGVSSDPEKGEPHILCVQDGPYVMKSTKITQTELTKLCDGIERCRRDIQLVSFRRGQISS